ncbi:MAG TPA: hypothetical protein VFB34_02600 [Chloroflexota bacterium]|nr:hypothetical protein [Chloroflexota bacterium]
MTRLELVAPSSDSVPSTNRGRLKQLYAPLDAIVELVRERLLPLPRVPLAALASFCRRYVNHDPGDVAAVGQVAATIAQLALIKSRRLLPDLDAQRATEEEGAIRQRATGSEMLSRYEPLLYVLSDNLDREWESFRASGNRPTATLPVVRQPLSPARLSSAYLLQTQEATRRSARLTPPVFLRLEAATRALRRSLGRLRQLSFWDVVTENRLDRRARVVYFLAVLELARQDSAVVEQRSPFGDILIRTRRKPAQAASRPDGPPGVQ